MSAPRHTTRRFEVFAAVLLGLAAMLSAFAVMRSAMIGDEVLSGFTLSSQYYNDANSFDSHNTQTFVADQNLFQRYVEARFAGDDDLARYLKEDLFRDDLRVAVVWWERRQRLAIPPESPFAEASPYRFERDPSTIYARGDAAFDEAKRADSRNDRFDQAVALLAITLFAAGLAALLKSRGPRRVLVTIAVCGLIAGIGFIVAGELG